MLQSLKEDLFLEDQLIDKYISQFETLLGHVKTKGIIEFFKSLTLTAGIKSSIENPSLIEPYITVEPSEKPNSNEMNSMNELLFDLSKIKKHINEVLYNNKIIIRVLIDKLDDFAVKEDYEIQRLLLQSLLTVEDSYFNTTNLKMYIFLRKDLYERLDFVALGSDKVRARTVELTWTKKDIWNFIARRLFYNYKNILELDGLKFSSENFSFKMEEKNIPSIFQNENSLFKILKKVLPKCISKNMKNFKSLRKTKVDFTEEINKEIIFSLMPEKVPHINENGVHEYIDFLDFIVSHFALGSGFVNPRHILIYFNMLFANLNDYYLNNPQLKIVKDENGKYNLIPEEIIQETYNDFKDSLIEIFGSLDKSWNDWFVKFQARRGVKYSFSYKDLLEMLQIHEKNEENFKCFLAFFVHSVFFEVPNNYKDYRKKRFILPIALRKAKNKRDE